MNIWMGSDILICLLSRSWNALRVNTGHKPIYEEYLELRVSMYELVRRWTFHSCALRAANDENRIVGWSTLRMICMFGNMFALLNGCWSVVSRVAGLLSRSIHCLCISFLGLRQSHGTLSYSTFIVWNVNCMVQANKDCYLNAATFILVCNVR